MNQNVYSKDVILSAVHKSLSGEAAWYEYFSEYNSHFPILIIFKMDDDGSALRVGAKYKSFTDLECALKKFQQDNYVQLYKRSSRKFDTGSKYTSEIYGLNPVL
jgi:hypothetical protein